MIGQQPSPSWFYHMGLTFLFVKEFAAKVLLTIFFLGLQYLAVLEVFRIPVWVVDSQPAGVLPSRVIVVFLLVFETDDLESVSRAAGQIPIPSGSAKGVPNRTQGSWSSLRTAPGYVNPRLFFAKIRKRLELICAPR